MLEQRVGPVADAAPTAVDTAAGVNAFPEVTAATAERVIGWAPAIVYVYDPSLRRSVSRTGRSASSSATRRTTSRPTVSASGGT